MNLRVGIVTNLYPWSGGPTLGTFVRDLVVHLRLAGAEVALINHRINFAAMSLECSIRSARLDILDAQFIAPAAIVTAFSPRFSPYVVTVHRWDILEFPYRYPLARLATLAALGNAAGVIAVGQTILSEVLKFTPPRSRVEVIPNAVDELRFRPDIDFKSLKQTLGIPEKHKVILSVGHLIPRKGHEYLIRATARILKRNKACSLVIVGEGPMYSRLQRLIRDLGISSNVKLSGAVADEMLPYYYTMSDIFAMPSTSEGHCVAILEAMASGKPIVASEIPANAESVVQNKNGFLVPPKSSEALADSILLLLNDDDLRERFGRYSRTRAIEEFSWRHRTEHLLDFYKSILAST
ncbi:MAG: glycosyltransferase [Candidatus Bathyarchaeia archaeon]